MEKSRSLPDFSDYFYRKIEEEGSIGQAEHLNELFKVLFEGCKFSESDYESQLCWITRDLNPRARKSIQTMAELIRLREEEEEEVAS